MTEVLQDFSDSALVKAIEGNYVERFRLFRFWSQAEVHDDADMLWTITDIPFPLFNSVLRAQMPQNEVDNAIDRAIIRCKARGVPMLWLTGPSTRPRNLGEQLRAQGFIKGDQLPGMAADLMALNDVVERPHGFDIDLVNSFEKLKVWYEVFSNVFGFPDFVQDAWIDSFASVGFDWGSQLKCYLGYVDGEPVATTFVVMGAGVVGVYGVGTIPGARQRGIGTVMTLDPLREARGRGYRIAVLRSSKMAFSVYSRVGFRKYCDMDTYTWGGA